MERYYWSNASMISPDSYYEALYRAALAAILEVGLKRFKETSLFMSNTRSEEHKRHAQAEAMKTLASEAQRLNLP